MSVCPWKLEGVSSALTHDSECTGECNLKIENYRNMACNVSNERVIRCPSNKLKIITEI